MSPIDPLYPLCFEPVYKDYPWGGDRIIRRYGRRAPPGIYAESWEVSAHPDGMSVAANGPLSGRTLADLVTDFGTGLVGTRSRTKGFPLLIKLIDSRQPLSVQVHPNDETAAAHGGEAKTEMWYVLEADPGACVYAGLKPGTTARDLEAAIHDHTVENLVVRVPVAAGDAVYIPGGRVHAIGAGCLLLEVQQTSNTTYRLYDWGRVGADGKPRELHVEKALQAIDWTDREDAKVYAAPKAPVAGSGFHEIYRSPYFKLEHALFTDAVDGATDGTTFEVLFCATGEVVLQAGDSTETLPAGTTCLIPSEPSRYRITPAGKSAEVLRITVA